MNRRKFVVSGVTGGLLGGMCGAAAPIVEKDPSPLLRAVYDLDWDLRLEAGGQAELEDRIQKGLVKIVWKSRFQKAYSVPVPKVSFLDFVRSFGPEYVLAFRVWMVRVVQSDRVIQDRMVVRDQAGVEIGDALKDLVLVAGDCVGIGPRTPLGF